MPCTQSGGSVWNQSLFSGPVGVQFAASSKDIVLLITMPRELHPLHVDGPQFPSRPPAS